MDGSPYRPEVLPGPSLRLTSQKDARSGIQFSRVVTLQDGSSILHVHATMKNIDAKPRSWGIWTNTQLDAKNPKGTDFNPDFRAYIPGNPHSHFKQGYKILFGSETNPQFQYDAHTHMMRIHYERQVGKVVMDSPAGWLANVDGSAGYVFVQTFRYDADRDYPDGASVEYWTNGLGKIFAWGKEVIQPNDAAENPYVAETELVGPYAHLKPGETASFDYEWRVARIGGSFPILDCTVVGCTAEAFVGKRTNNGELSLSGRFGVFYAGTVRARILDAQGNRLLETAAIEISPDSPLVAQSDFPTMSAPANAHVIELVVYDAAGKAVGMLARCTM